jgi:hypothetical protein
VNRRSLLTWVALALATSRLPLHAILLSHGLTKKSWRHGMALFGDFKYPAGFKQFDYVSVSAPKGGTVRKIALCTYDNFNVVGIRVVGSDRRLHWSRTTCTAPMRLVFCSWHDPNFMLSPHADRYRRNRRKYRL